MMTQHQTPEQWAATTWAESPFGEAIDPTWFILYAPARAHAASKLQAKLKREWSVESFYPTKIAWRKLGRGKDRKSEKVILPILGGVVFAEFRHRPRWHVLKGQRIIADVVQRGIEPAALTPRDMGQIAGFRDMARKQKASKFKPGDMVEVRRGPFMGWSAPVKQIKDDLAVLGISLLGRDVKFDLADLEGE